ncbi:Rho GTPase-activating protein 29 [Blomia tropicalis]|nr:Rho GTPase-activating protein 29 [Blomia tropicalis]
MYNSNIANRRHSSEMKNILPKISISRAKSEIDLVINSVNDEQCVNGISLLHPNRRSDRSTLASTNLSMSTTIQSRSLQPISHLKEHKYQSVTKVLNLKSDKCRICSESIYFHCYECVQCKLMAHKKCLQNLYIKCPNKPMPPRLAVFGLNISNDNQISEVLSVCVREIENRPIHQLKSIYKMDGDRYTIKRICLSFEFGPHLIDLDNISVHDIAGVVKEYLIQLSTPIFSNEIQDELITIGKEWPVRKVPYTQSGLAILIFELRRLMSYLSPSYRKNLTFLIYHFKRIVDSQNITEINANALGMTFANIIFKVCQRGGLRRDI